jgi:hypothetical protein
MRSMICAPLLVRQRRVGFTREFALNHFARSASESSPAARARNDAAASTSVAVIRTPFNSANKWMILCDPKGERGSEAVDGRINFISRLVLGAIERRIQQASIANSRETTMLGEGLHVQRLDNTWRNEAPRTNRLRRNCGCL